MELSLRHFTGMDGSESSAFYWDGWIWVPSFPAFSWGGWNWVPHFPAFYRGGWNWVPLSQHVDGTQFQIKWNWNSHVDGTQSHFSQHFAGVEGTGSHFSQHFAGVDGTGLHFPQHLSGVNGTATGSHFLSILLGWMELGSTIPSIFAG